MQRVAPTANGWMLARLPLELTPSARSDERQLPRRGAYPPSLLVAVAAGERELLPPDAHAPHFFFF